MQELNGYIKLFRKLIRWGWYQDNVVKGLFIHCLLCASYKDFEWMGMGLKAGQFITSLKHLSEELGFSVQQIRTAIKKLESTGEITSTSTNKYTIITVVNWENFQSFEDESNTESNNPITNEQQTDNKRATNEQQHRKNIKNINNFKNTKKRENNAHACATPSSNVVSIYCLENKIPLSVGEKFYDYYSARKWKTTRGSDISDSWQAKLDEWNKRELSKDESEGKYSDKVNEAMLRYLKNKEEKECL